MGKKARLWKDMGQEQITVAELDSNNLPISEDPLSVPNLRYKRDVPSNQPYFNENLSESSGKYLYDQSRSIWDEEAVKAGVQPFFNKAGKGLVSRGLSIAPKIGQGIGHIGGAIAYGMDYITDPETADPNIIWDNAVSNTMQNIDEKLREAMPIHKSYYGRTGNLLQQMADPGFWFDDMFDSLAFLASAAGTGMGIGAVAKGLGLSKAMIQGAKVYGSTIFNGIAESGFEAKGFADTEREKLAYKDHGMSYGDLTDLQQVEIKDKVSEGTANVFKGNAGVLIIPNYVQSRFMFGKLGDAAKRIRRGVHAGTLSAGDVKVFKQAAKQASLGVFTEGPWEEGMQHALQSYSGRKDAFGLNFDDYMLGVANQWVNNWSTTEGQKNMMLGAIVGGVFGGAGAIREGRQERGIIKTETEILHDKIIPQLNADDRWYSEYMKVAYKQFDHIVKGEGLEDDGTMVEKKYKSYYNEKGEVEIDYEKAQKMFLYGLNNKFLYDEAMVASIDGNNMHLDRVNKDALARLYYNYATNQNMTLDEAEDMLLEREMQLPFELAQEGVTKKFTKSDLAPLREAFEKAENDLMSAEDFTETDHEAAFKMLVRKTLFGEAVKRDQYEQYLSNPDITTEQKEDVRRLIEDSQKLTDELNKKNTREKLLDQFKKERLTVGDHLDNIAKVNEEGAPESEKMLAQFEMEEFIDINGRYSPYSTAFELAEDVDGATLARPLGSKYNYYYTRGQTHYRKANLNALIEQAQRDPSKVNDVVKMMATDIQDGVRYTKEDVQKIQDLIKDKERLRVRWDREARKRQDAIDSNFGPIKMNPTYDPTKLAKDEKWMEDHLRRINDLERAKEDFNDKILGVELPTDKKEMKDQRKAQRHFQRSFVDKKISRGQSILDSQKSNPDAYSNLTALEDILNELNQARKVYDMPGRNRLANTTTEFRGMKDELNRVISELSDIQETVRENQLNRELQDIKTQQSYSAALFSALGIDVTSGEANNQALVETIKSIITEEEFDSIIASAAANEGHPFDSIYVEKIIKKVKESEDGTKRLLQFLEAQNIKKIADFEAAYKKLPFTQQPGMAGSAALDLEVYKVNPKKAFERLLELATNRIQDPATVVTDIDKFLNDKDVYALKAAIDEGAAVGYKSLSREDLIAMLDAHLSITSAIRIIERLRSDVDFAKMLATEAQTVENMEHAPSNQQRIAMREAVILHNTKISNPKIKYAGWIYLKGLAGTGKTKLIAVYLPEILGVKSENILAISTHPNALGVLDESLSDVKNVILDTELTEDHLNNPNTEVVIIDEVARLNGPSLNTIARNVAIANKERKSPLRVYVMGDPSQVIGENSEFAAINNILVNVEEITPLTAVFRSGNTALLHVSNSFLNFPGKISDLVATSSEELGDPSDGVHVSTSQTDLLNQLKIHSNKNTGNKRSRAIVVSNQTLYNQYKKLGQDVFMHYDVAGLEYDEVYLDIDPQNFDSNGKFNQAMYTATSRTKEYMFIRSYEPFGKWRSEKGKITKVDPSERANQIRSEYTERLIMERDVMGKDMEGVIITSPQRLRPTEKNLEDISEPQTVDDEATSEPQSTIYIDDIAPWGEDLASDPNTPHDLEFPSFKAVRLAHKVTIDGKVLRKGNVQEGSRVLYLRTKGEGDKSFVTIVARNLNPADNKPDAGENWSVIGIMSDNELENTERGRYLKNLLAKGSGQDQFNRLRRGDEGKLLIDIEKDPNHGSILAEGVVHRARPLSYRYTSTLTSGRGMLQDLMNKARIVFGDPNHKLEYSVQIFTNKQVSSGEYEGNIAGVPYLVIKRNVMKDGELVIEKKPQFIRLSGRALNLNDDVIQSIDKFDKLVELLDKIEGLTFGEEKTNVLVKRFRNNFDVENGKPFVKTSKEYSYKEYSDEQAERDFPLLTENQFDQLEEIAHKMIPMFYGVGMVKKEVNSPDHFLEYLGPLLERKDMTYRYVPHGGDKVGGFIEQEDEKGNKEYLRVEGLRDGRGEVQIQLDMLAKANKNASWVVSKVMADNRDGKKRLRYVSASKSLFAESTTYGGYYQHLLEYFKELSIIAGKEKTYRDYMKDRSRKLNTEESINEVEQQIAAMEEDGLIVKGHSYQELQKKKAEHIHKPITQETLKEILAFGEGGSHASLFYPLKIKGKGSVNELGKVDPTTKKMDPKNINALDDMLGKKLEEILPTRIQVVWDKKVPSKPKESKTKAAVKKNLDKIRKKSEQWGKRTMLKGQELGKPITFEEGRKLLRKFIPTIDQEGEDIMKFVDELTLRQLAGEDAYGLYENEAIYVLEKDGTTFVNPIRHEAFHKIYTEHLSPAEQDLINRAFVKEFPQHKNKTKFQIEELLTQTFHNYQTKKLTKVNQILKNFFNWLASRLRFVNLNTTSLTRFFETIESGYFVEKKYSGLGITRRMRDIKRRYGIKGGGMQAAINHYNDIRNKIEQQIYLFNKYGSEYKEIEDRYGNITYGYGTPMTKDEAIEMTYSTMEQEYYEPDNGIKAEYENSLRPGNDMSADDRIMIANTRLVYVRAMHDFNDILKDIYENYKPRKKFIPGEIIIEDRDIELDQLVEIQKADAERVNHKAHIIPSDEVDHERKVSRVVKDYLSNIGYENGVMNWREVYIRSLNMLEGIQTWSEDFMSQLSGQVKSLGNHARDRVIADALYDIHEQATTEISLIDGRAINNNIKFLNEDIFIYADESVIDIHGIDSLSSVAGEYITRKPGQTTKGFIADIAASGIDPTQVVDQFRKYQALDMLRGIINVFNNQKQKNIFLVESKWDYGELSISYLPGSYMGIHRSLSSTINDRLRNKFPDLKTLKSWKTLWLKDKTKNVVSLEDKHQFVKKFIKYIGLGAFANDIPQTGSSALYNDIIYFFERAETGSAKMGRTIVKEGEADRISDMSDVLSSERKMVNSLSRQISFSSKYMRATNVRDVKGKRKYTWSPTSNAYETLFNFVRNTLYTTGDLAMEAPRHLRKAFFTDHNIFLNARSRIFDVVDNDGLKYIYSQGEPRAVTLEEEKSKENLTRTFVAGFIDRIHRSSSNENTYFQFLYPNERTSAVGAEVKVLSRTEIRDAIRSMIEQTNAREDQPTLKDYNRKNNINFRYLDRVKTKDIDKAVEQIMQMMAVDARQLADNIVTQKVQLSNDTNQMKSLDKFAKEYDSYFETPFDREALKDDWAAEQLYPLVMSYFANDYVNSYYLNQLILGDYAQFENEEDVMRRFSLASAPGHKPIVNEKFGMKPKARFLYLTDPVVDEKGIKERIEKLLKTDAEKAKLPILMAAFEKNFDSSDGQGFMTPERYDELKHAGFNSGFPLGNVMKPVVFTIDENGFVRAVKYSSIVLSDELVREFPSLGILRDNMRRNSIDEAVFGSGVKVGTPALAPGLDNHQKIIAGEYITDPTEIYEVNNDDYRIQLDPRAEIEGSVRQPSQLIALAGILDHNQKDAASIFNHFTEIVKTGGIIFNDRFGSVKKIKRNITSILRGHGSEREHDMIADGLSIDFPSVTNKVSIALAAELQSNIVDIRWKGSKLVLQSGFGIAKYNNEVIDGGQNLEYFRDSAGRLVAEVVVPRGLLPKEYEDMIEMAIANNEHADNYFNLPDLLGFRVPTSDMHSAIAMKVVGFYTTPDTNVIIAPDLLVALHGSDFDVDTLFVMRRERERDINGKEDINGDPLGYKKEKGSWVFNRKMQSFATNQEKIAYHKNGILDRLLDIVSSAENMEAMLAPIPLNPIRKAKRDVMKLRKISTDMDLSNANDKLKAYDNIFGASRAVKIFGNALKGIAYMLRTGDNNTMPKLLGDGQEIKLNGKTYEQIQLNSDLIVDGKVQDKTGERVTITIDGFMNAAIDNIRELALPILNITDETINGLIALMALGVDLKTIVNLLQQPILLDMSKGGGYKTHYERLVAILGSDPELSEIQLNNATLSAGIKAGNGLNDMPLAIVDEKRNPKAEEKLKVQMLVLKTFEQASILGRQIGNLASFLNIGRTIPVKKTEIDTIITTGEEIFGPVNENGTTEDFGSSMFAFDIQNLFKKNPHLFEIYQKVRSLRDLLEESLKKYNPRFQDHVNEIYNAVDSFTMKEQDAKELIREQLLNYLISREIYSGEYRVDQDVVHTYFKDVNGKKVKQEMTGPKAVNQIFIQKVIKLKEYIMSMQDGQDNPVQNTFLDHINELFNSNTRTYELAFEGRANMDPRDMLDVQAAFLELNQYDVLYNKKNRKYEVIQHKTPRPDNEYSDIQKEFVTYGIMNWGLGFGATNYSIFLPSDLFKGVDKMFNDLMDRMIGVKGEEGQKQAKELFNKIKDDFLLQFSSNKGNLIKALDNRTIKADVITTARNRQGDVTNVYFGEENGYKFDRKYTKEEGREFPLFIKDGYKENQYIYVRLNDPAAESVYYAIVDKIAPFQTYHTTDEVLDSGYSMGAAYHEQIDGKPIRNFRVSDINEKSVEYRGEDVKVGDIVSLTVRHDITRVNKKYMKVKVIAGNTYSLVPTKLQGKPFETVDVSEDYNPKSLQAISAIDQGHHNYANIGKVSALLDQMIERATSERRRDLLKAFRKQIIDQEFILSFRRLPGRYQGSYLYDGSIGIDLVNIYREQGQIDQDYIDRIIFHEMAHGVTLIPYYENEGLRKKVDGVIARFFTIAEDGRLQPKNKRVNGILTDMLPDKANHRGFKDAGEFMAEIMANDEFATAIDALREPKKKSLLRQIWDTLLEWIGIKRDGSITADLIRAFKNVKHKGQGQVYQTPEGKVQVLTPEGITLAAESVAYENEVIEQEVEESSKEKDPIRDKMNREIIKIMEDSKRMEVDKDENGEELNTYSVKGLLQKIKRISDNRGGMISFFSNRKIDVHVTFGQFKADYRWGSRDKEHKLQTDKGMENYEEFKERMERSSRNGMIKGSIVHLFLKREFNRLYNLGYSDIDIQKELHDMASMSEGDVMVDHHRWVEKPENLKKIFKAMGLNYYYEGDNKLKDVKVLSEISIWSELLGFGGTIDVLAAHADGRYSIRDVKTGMRFGERVSSDPLKYGLQDIYITDNQRERAKLQVMWYAFLLKLENREMRFRDLQVTWLPNELLLDIDDHQKYVEVGSYLRMIQTFLQDKKALKEAGINEDVYNSIIEKSPRIFDVGQYTDKSSDVLFKELVQNDISPEEAYRRRMEEMEIIKGKMIADRQIRVEELPEKDRKRLATLWGEIQIMRSDPSTQLDAFPGKDIGKLTEWLGNYSDVNMGEFQTWKKIRDQQYNTYTQQHVIDLKHMMKLVDPIYKKYMKGKLRLSFGGQDRIANVNYAELFGFAYKEVQIGGYTRERLITKEDDEWNESGRLTDDQKKLLTYLNNKFSEWFVGQNAYLNKVGGEINGENATWLEIFNKGKGDDTKMKWYDGWFPKVMKTQEELNYEEGARIKGQQVGRGDIQGANFIGHFTANSIKTRIRNNLTRYVDNTFEMYDDVRMALPIKYLDNMSVMNEQGYSKNLVIMFDRWNKSMLHKSHMDEVYIAGEGLKQYLLMKKHANGQPMFENTIGFLEKKLIGDIQNRTIQQKWTQTPIPGGWIRDPVTGNRKKVNVDLDKVIGAMMGWTSATIMWLRPLQGGGNGLHAKILTYRESIKGSIASTFLHIDGDAIDFQVKDNIFADKVYFTEFLPAVMLGNMQQNKLWLLAEKLNYIPDNYDYATNRRFLLSTRNAITDSSSMYLFHSKPEEYVSLTTMAAQLHHLKHPTNGKSLWDNYTVEKNPETGVHEIVWKGGIRGYEQHGKGETATKEAITELTSHEISKLKKVHERMQGGYRKEEAANLEVYVMGKAMIQFKKYLPRLIMNALGSKKEVVDLGYYKTIVENGMKDQDGKPVDIYEWTARLNEGRWRTLVNAIATMAGLGSAEYKWSAMSTEQKQNIIDAILTLGIWSIMSGAYLTLFYDDDDDDTFKKWWKNYLILNVSQQYNPMDLLHTLESASRPVSVARMYKATESFYMMLIATGDLMFKEGDNAFTSDGDLKGWNNFKRSIPYLASWEDFSSKMRSGAPTEEWWTEKFENKWR